MKNIFLLAMQVLTMTVTSCIGSNYPSGHDAAVMVQNHTKASFDPECKFQLFGEQVTNMGQAHFSVKQRFYSSAFGYPRCYECKAIAIYLGGDKNLRINWLITDFSIEEVPPQNLWGD